MTANEIRKAFLDFFEKEEHTIVPSASLVPPEEVDKTVLFTTAGMQQFKRHFMGQADGLKRAASCQKCLRTDDLDKVGKTPYHHTFFEMLGNFSFGDYFKKEAIVWAWEFLTQKLKIPAEKLWVSVYQEDEEAYNYWLNDVKIPANKIVKLGDKSNFWPSEAQKKGPNGPCGPCSEIFYDYGVNKDCPKGEACNPDCSCGRFSEVWNLVFTQFNRKEGGVLEPLPGKNIDTGMGLERLVAVVQEKKSNYETDLFISIINAIDKETLHNGYSLNIEDKRIIADHIRAIVFGINDGVIPSNDGRGYIIKRLIIDATDKMIPLGKVGTRLYKLVPVVIDIVKEPYHELTSKSDDICNIIKKVQESYLINRNERLPELKSRAEKISQLNIPVEQKVEKLGQLGFLYRDTYGLTFQALASGTSSAVVFIEQTSNNDKNSIMKEITNKINIHIDQQREKSRASSKMTGDVFANAELNLNVPKTEFLGYDEKNYHTSGKILKLFVNNQEVSEVKEGDIIKIILDKTPFYAESGGQVGDTGIMANTGGRIKITDTQKIADVFIHMGTVESGNFKPNDEVLAQIDIERRLSIMRNHTATHLLQAALRKVLGTHVQQQGSLVAPDRLRFDFTHPQAITKEQMQTVESIINGQIMACDPVEKQTMGLGEAKDTGAMAFFAEKYKDVVRVVSIGNYSKELCGGTHLKSTGEIGPFKITSESAIAQGIRRIEARTGTGALDFIREREKEEAQRNDTQAKRLAELEKKKETDNLLFESIKNSIDTIIKDADSVKDIKIITHAFKNADANILRKASDLLKMRTKSAVITLASQYLESAFILVSVTDDLVKKGIKANEIIKNIAPLINGSGGGRPELAQAGSKEVEKIGTAIKEARKLLKESIKT